MTRMPASRPLILNLVASAPVTAPARNPPPNAAAVAIPGWTPLTSNAAASAAPSALEPSAVMSGKAKMRKLMKTTSASRERMSPIVRARSAGSSWVPLLHNLRDRPRPAGAPNEFALSSADDGPIVTEQVQDALERLVLEERSRRGFQVDLALLHRTVGERRSVEMAGDRLASVRRHRAQGPDHGREGASIPARRHAGDQRYASRVGALRREGEPVSDSRESKRRAFGGVKGGRASQGCAHEAG